MLPDSWPMPAEITWLKPGQPTNAVSNPWAPAKSRPLLILLLDLSLPRPIQGAPPIARLCQIRCARHELRWDGKAANAIPQPSKPPALKAPKLPPKPANIERISKHAKPNTSADKAIVGPK